MMDSGYGFGVFSRQARKIDTMVLGFETRGAGTDGQNDQKWASETKLSLDSQRSEELGITSSLLAVSSRCKKKNLAMIG